MSFENYEESADSGRPFELFEFTYQGGVHRYTNHDRDYTISAVTYLAAQLRRDPIKSDGDITRADLGINTTRDFPIARLFNPIPPSDVVLLTIRRAHVDEPDDQRIMWKGRVVGAQWPNGAAKLTCKSIQSTMKQLGLRRHCQRNCPHSLYKQGDGECNVNQVDFRETVLISGVAGLFVTGAGFATFVDGWFTGGKFEWETSPGVFEKRSIKSHVGDTIELTHPVPGLVGLVEVDAYPGCDRTLATCRDKFDNEVNHGGFPHMKKKNPFGVNSVF